MWDEKVAYLLIGFLFLLVSVGTFGMASAATAAYAPVEFYAVDGNSDDSVQLSVIGFSAPFQLQYPIAGNLWSPAGSMIDVNTTDDLALVELRLYSETATYYYGTLTPSGENGTYSNLDLYHTFLIMWENGTSFTVATAVGTDNLAAVPIPASALLLGTGLIDWWLSAGARSTLDSNVSSNTVWKT